MKRFILSFLSICIFITTASADILPTENIYQDFYAWTGIETTPAVILCESLSVCDDRDGKKVATLLGAGGRHVLPVIESWDGWAKVYYNDGNDIGWVRSDYLIMNPAWYLTVESTPIYAYADAMSPKVALLDAGKKLPIITETDDWVLVSIRNAAGWIRKTAKDTAKESWFSIDMINRIQSAALEINGEFIFLSEPEKLSVLEELLTNAEDTGMATAGCPFTAALAINLQDGTGITMSLATDSCCIFRINERDYKYARHLYDPFVGGLTNACLFDLFGIQTPVTYTE